MVVFLQNGFFGINSSSIHKYLTIVYIPKLSVRTKSSLVGMSQPVQTNANLFTLAQVYKGVLLVVMNKCPVDCILRIAIKDVWLCHRSVHYITEGGSLPLATHYRGLYFQTHKSTSW